MLDYYRKRGIILVVNYFKGQCHEDDFVKQEENMMKIKKIVALVLACVMAMTGLVACGRDPKETVEDAFATLAEGKSAKGLVDELGITEIMEGLEKKPFTVGMKLALDETNLSELEMLKSGSIYTEIACDTEAKKALLDLGVGFGGTDLVSGQLYVDEKQLAVAAPELLDKVFYIEFDNIIKNFKNSALFDMMEMSDDDFAMIEEAFANMGGLTGDADTEEMVEFILGFQKEVEKFKDKIEVEEIDAEEFEINGKNRKCDGYEVTITEKSIVSLAEAAIDYYLLSDDAKEFFDSLVEQVEEAGGVAADMDELYDAMDEIKENKGEILDMIEACISDVKTEMYIYDGEIVSLEAKMEISDPSGKSDEKVKIGLKLECTGGEYSVYDNYELAVKMMGITVLKLEKESETDGDDYSAEWTVLSAALEDVTIGASFAMNKKDGDFEASAIFDDGDTKVAIASEGKIEVEKKKSVKVGFDELTFELNEYGDVTSIGLSGEYYVECAADVSMPKGDKFNVLTDKESDWEALAEDLEDVMGALEDLMGGSY